MAKKLQKLLKSFTLIELIIVIAIIAVLGASAFLMLSQWMSKSRDSRKLADLTTIDNAINISIAKNDKLPKPDNVSKIMFSGSRIWDVGYFGDEAVQELGGTLTKSPIDPTTKQRYRYAQWNNQKYQLGTIIENQQFSKYSNKVYAQSYYTRLQGNYNQSIIITKVENIDTILPVPSLIVDEYEGEEKILENEHFWTNKGTYSLGTEQKKKILVQSLYSGDLSKLSDSTSSEFEQFISNFENVYSGSNFLPILNVDQTQDQMKVSIAQELSKVSSQPVAVKFLGCEGYNHGSKLDFFMQEAVGFGESCDSVKAQFECSNGNWIGDNKDNYIYTTCNVQLPGECEGNPHGSKVYFYKNESALYGQTCESIKAEFECNNGSWIGENKSEYIEKSCNVLTPAKCDGIDHLVTKNFYKESSVAFGGNCDDHKKNFTCDNGVWMDGESIADNSLYKYSSCMIGTPLNCNSENLTYKSVTNLDVLYSVPQKNHGESFSLDKNVTESNGIFE
ncbi:MAG: prepilin-type N-terminal cleavage/methylation domain-containing protein, partial [Candidatus Absconditabacteria bacterium]